MTSERPSVTRSVVGTIDIEANDPLLDTADEALRVLVETSVSRRVGS